MFLSFLFSPSISLSLPFSHKYYDHFIYCILGGFILFLWGGFVVGRRVYFVRSHQCPCHAKYSNFQDYWTLIQTWECFPIKVLYLQVHILASRWNYILFSLMWRDSHMTASMVVSLMSRQYKWLILCRVIGDIAVSGWVWMRGWVGRVVWCVPSPVSHKCFV